MTKTIRTAALAAAIFLAALPIATVPSYADEGMWLPALISQRMDDLSEKGFRLSAEDLYSINQASLKDAIVLFGRGCTGELISPEGLLLTNHHCGYPQIQRHSSVEHDYLTDGFWAMTREEELPNEGLTVSFLDRMEDVTARVLSGYEAGMSEAQRDSVVRANSKVIIEEATAEGNGLRASVESLYYGNQYFIFVYREYRDVRLVGAPPSSIGSFGGDTDNWMWPRHTGDFSIFRIYADKDNNPADYSEDNVPYRPKKYFTISTKGVSQGDFTLVYGFPGSTQEYIMSEGIRYVAEVSDPHKIALRTLRLDIQNRYMDSDPEIRIKYASKNAGVANAWKKWQGEMQGIRRLGTVKARQDYEARFNAWAAGTQYEGLTSRLGELYRELEPLNFAYELYRESAGTIELASFALSISNLAGEPDSTFQTTLASRAGNFFKDYYMPIDKDCFKAVMQYFQDNLPQSFWPEYFSESIEKYGDCGTWADSLFASSIFTDKEKVMALTSADSTVIAGDPAFIFGTEFASWQRSELRPDISRLNEEIRLLYRDYMRAQMEFEPDKAFYPDANLTLRIAYGHVAGYSPADGVDYAPVSTIRGIMEKDRPEIYDYNVPQRFRDIYAQMTPEQRSVPVCFLATNHTSGGNSGSPVINADGQLIGINFDRVWEGTMSDIDFDPDYCRNISVDIRFVLFVIDQIGGASHLIEEMTLD